MRPTFLSVALAIVGCGAAAQAESAAEALRRIYQEEWEYNLREDPVLASNLGDTRYADQWPDVSLAAIERRHQHRQDVVTRLNVIDPSTLSDSERLNLELFRQQLAMEIEAYRFLWYLLPVNQRDGIQVANEVAEGIAFGKVADYEAWIARLKRLPTYMDQQVALMRVGIDRGRVHPKVILSRVPAQIAAQIVADPKRSPFYKPFERMPETIDEGDRERLRAAAERAIANIVVPAYQQFATFFEKDYLPEGSDRVGVFSWPDGPQLYAFRARYYTTTNLTPEDIHAIGVREVTRLRGEMANVLNRVGFTGSFAEFLDFLRRDPRFYYRTPEELLESYRTLCKTIDPHLPKLFGRLPKVGYRVEPIPANMAPDTTTAYYLWPAADGSRPGTYFVNLFRPETRPKYEMTALSLHEAVPGHHLQIALAMEQQGLPPFRRFNVDSYTAFVEGWGLYAESLGEEMGLYRDPYVHFGKLTYEVWRAIRLVVDTGMHQFGWTRERAIAYFKENAAKSELDIVNEIDRYIAWPGQALAYKIGELKIKELRARAERQLGRGFDIRAFHDALLADGAVPLDLLEAKITAWIAAQPRGQ